MRNFFFVAVRQLSVERSREYKKSIRAIQVEIV